MIMQFVIGPQDRVVAFAIDSFLRHPAFDVSDHAIFHFSPAVADTFLLNRHGDILSPEQYGVSLERLESEGLGGESGSQFDTNQIQAFSSYQPKPRPACMPFTETRS